jgi:hypothetical protein
MAGISIEYVLLIVFIAILFGIPPLRWLYRSYVKAMLQIAGDKVTEYKKQISERISDAGRKVSQRMRA